VATSADSSLGITFNDATTFHLSANAKITIDNYVYEDGGKQNAGIFDITKGTVAFVAAAVAKTGDMKITTPTATLGIRGTTGLVEVPENATAGGANNVNIKLYPDADGRVGRIEVNDRMGTRLGALTQAASGFAIRPGAGGRFAAAPLVISRQQAARDQGFVRQVHATQSVGRQIVTEQRAIRRANPGRNAPNRGNQPGQQRPNQLPGQNRPGQPQPGAPNRQENRQGNPQQNRQGQLQRPGGPQQPGRPPRPGENLRQGGQPGTPQRPGRNPELRPGAQPPAPQQPGVQPRQGGLQPRPPGVQRPGPAGRPALQRPRPAPRGKPEKKKRN
jgi:FecR protein